MDILVEKFLDEHRKKIEAEKREVKNSILEQNDIYEKVYAEHYSDEYPYYDEANNKYFKKVYPEISDDEFEQICDVMESEDAFSDKHPVRRGASRVGFGFKLAAIIILVIAMIQNSAMSISATHSLLKFTTIMSVLNASFVSPLILYGIGEIICLLSELNKKEFLRKHHN